MRFDRVLIFYGALGIVAAVCILVLCVAVYSKPSEPTLANSIGDDSGTLLGATLGVASAQDPIIGTWRAAITGYMYTFTYRDGVIYETDTFRPNEKPYYIYHNKKLLESFISWRTYAYLDVYSYEYKDWYGNTYCDYHDAFCFVGDTLYLCWPPTRRGGEDYYTTNLLMTRVS